MTENSLAFFETHLIPEIFLNNVTTVDIVLTALYPDPFEELITTIITILDKLSILFL